MSAPIGSNSMKRCRVMRPRPRSRPGGRGAHSAPARGGEVPLAGRTILLHAEQGFGDTLQFVRYAALVAALGATVLLEVQAPLKSLLSGIEGIAHIFARGGQ